MGLRNCITIITVTVIIIQFFLNSIIEQKYTETQDWNTAFIKTKLSLDAPLRKRIPFGLLPLDLMKPG